MTVEDEKSGGVGSVPPRENYYEYGTFQGVANYPPPPVPGTTLQPQPQQQRVVFPGFPQPIPPPHPYYHSLGYQSTASGYTIDEGRPLTLPRLPCCGIGIGWFLFLSGFFLGAIPWYIGAFMLVCVRVDYREKAGLLACTLAAILAVIAVSLGATRANHSW